MQSSAKTVEQYIEELPEERKESIKKLREIILKNLPEGFEEEMQYGMIGYVVPLSKYPTGYLGKKDTPLPYISIASQKNHMAIYHMGIYGNPDHEKWIEDEFEKAGKKLDMGKSCIRFRRLDQLPLDVIAKAVSFQTPDEVIEIYEKNRKK